MADRYVKLDDVMDAIGGVPKKKDSPYPTPIHLAAERIVKKLKERIAKVPTADVVEVKHEEWVEWYPPKEYILTGEEMLYYCTNCDAKYSDVEGYKYCPYCGAKMDGKDTNVPTK